MMDLFTDTTLLYWRSDDTVGISDTAALAEHPTGPVPALATVTLDGKVASLTSHRGRLFATTAAGGVLELTLGPGGLEPHALNLPTGGTDALALDETHGELLVSAPLLGVGGRLLGVSWNEPTPQVRVIDEIPSGFGRIGWTADAKSGQSVIHLLWDGALVPVGQGQQVFTPLSLGESELSGGRLFAMKEAAINSPGGTQVRMPDFAHPAHRYEKVTTEMVDDINRGSAVTYRIDEQGTLQIYVSTAGGLVFRFPLDPQTGAALDEPTVSRDLGWKAAGMALGHRSGKPVLLVGTWLSDGELEGHTYLLDPLTLEVLDRLDSGVASWGIAQTDLEADGQSEIIVGSLSGLRIYDTESLELRYASPPALVGYREVIALDAAGHRCELDAQGHTTGCLVHQIVVQGAGGLSRFLLSP